MKLVWTAEAISQIEAIINYVAADNPQAALDLADLIITGVDDQLTANPRSGRPGRVEGTRELIVHPSYIVAYRLTITAVEVLSVRHAARLWPDSF